MGNRSINLGLDGSLLRVTVRTSIDIGHALSGVAHFFNAVDNLIAVIIGGTPHALTQFFARLSASLPASSPLLSSPLPPALCRWQTRGAMPEKGQGTTSSSCIRRFNNSRKINDAFYTFNFISCSSNRFDKNRIFPNFATFKLEVRTRSDGSVFGCNNHAFQNSISTWKECMEVRNQILLDTRRLFSSHYVTLLDRRKGWEGSVERKRGNMFLERALLDLPPKVLRCICVYRNSTVAFVVFSRWIDLAARVIRGIFQPVKPGRRCVLLARDKYVYAKYRSEFQSQAAIIVPRSRMHLLFFSFPFFPLLLPLINWFNRLREWLLLLINLCSSYVRWIPRLS